MMTTELEDITGGVTLIGAIALNITEMISGVSMNGWFVFFTSVGGLVYLFWKIKTQMKASKLKDLEIEAKLLEIERLKKDEIQE